MTTKNSLNKTNKKLFSKYKDILSTTANTALNMTEL